MSSVWFITGASNGLGRSLALRVLDAGHNVIAAMRNPSRSPEATKQIQDARGKVFQLDLTESREGIFKKIKEAESIFGRIDVLVNNAGYSILGPTEHFSEKENTTLFQTNVFGPLYTIQAALPAMRSRRSGTIINISSVAGLDAGLACGLYASSKFALEGYTEALSKEVKDFGIDVLLVEPGAFRTNFLNAMTISENGIGEVYEQGPVGQAIERFRSASGKQAGDPEKLVDRIVEYVTGKGDAGALNGKVLRLVLGKDAHSRIVKKIEWLNNDLELGYSVTSSTDL